MSVSKILEIIRKNDYIGCKSPKTSIKMPPKTAKIQSINLTKHCNDF